MDGMSSITYLGKVNNKDRESLNLYVILEREKHGYRI